ncbi:MAG: efflux RND transporter permease subunit, partial [Acidiferrobacterales bacterium]|nr:efflux RND transporter permease subunit [Acidiferrobacterales bacterium]
LAIASHTNGFQLTKMPLHNKKTDANHIASIRVHLRDQPEQQLSALEFEKAWRQQIGNVPTAERIHLASTRNPSRPLIAYSLQHDDRETLLQAASEFRNKLAEHPAIYGLSDNATPGKLHFQIELTPEGRAAGLSIAEVGYQLRAAFHGLTVQRIQRGHDELRVVVRYPRENRDDLYGLMNERLRVSKNGEIPFHYIADIKEERELASLSSIDGNQAIFIEGFVDLEASTPRKVRRTINDDVASQIIENYPGLVIEPESSIRDERNFIKTLSILMPFTLLAMYVIVATYLRSYWKPLVVIFGIPVAFTGAIFGHWVLGWNFSTMSMFGVIGVMGVIFNDALILLDKYNNLKIERPNLPVIAVAAAAMHSRFRAVFLTTLTTLLALSPLLYERSEELLVFVPFVVSILGGLVLTSLFTLFILPNLVMLFEGRKE